MTKEWQCFLGWMVHAFTASGALVGLLSLLAISAQHYIAAFWFMALTIIIDAVDGMFARMIHVKKVIPKIDGALLDNIVDFLNYTIVPCFFLLESDILPVYVRFLCVAGIIFSSCYQFTQVDAKTSDHFFKGFPSYWNIVVFYLFFWQMHSWLNVIILLSLAILSFVPIKYIYPSRLDYLTKSKILRLGMLLATLLWGISTAGLLWLYPASSSPLVWISMGYLLLYMLISLYRTFFPLEVEVSQDYSDHATRMI